MKKKIAIYSLVGIMLLSFLGLGITLSTKEESGKLFYVSVAGISVSSVSVYYLRKNGIKGKCRR
ncbi:hypothetical protein [Enterococcus sp. AZ101]|uniref:hypothetical protein n=1 Tax=Enterococcus sp. AZ101 TaxID=2774742 RepID=UPI003D265C4F